MEEIKTDNKHRRGFASMTPERRKEIASLGGKSVAPENRSFSRDKELASKAGSKGGLATLPAKRAFSQSKSLAESAGRKGGRALQKLKASRKPKI